jgi:hypothetical protein
MRIITKIVLFQLILMVSLQTAVAARLPVVGEDGNEWGTLLNDFLLTSHTADGALKNFYVNGSNITFEGATDDDFNLILNIGDPTAERTVTLPDASGEICLLGQTIEGGELASDISMTTTGNIVLGSSASELRILGTGDGEESPYYGIFDVGILSNDRSYKFPDTDGTIVVADSGDGSITTTGDIIIDSINSVFKILGTDTGEISASEGGYYGIFDIAQLSGDRYYTFPDISGTVVMVNDEDGAITTTGNIILDRSDSDLWILDNDGGYYGVIDVDELSDETYYTFPDNGGGQVSILGQTIDSGEIEDGSITTDDLSDGTITDADIADDAITIGSGGTPITSHLSTAAADLVSASIAARSCDSYGTITVGGASVGDTVVASPAAGSSAEGIEDTDLMWNAYVSSANTVTIRACNPTNVDIDADDDQEWRADVWKH